jgi:hypothetical protein
MYRPWTFIIAGPSQISFTGANPLEAQNFTEFVETAPTAYIETLDGSYYDAYGGTLVGPRPTVVTFRCIYQKSSYTYDMATDAMVYYETLKNNYIGQTGTLAGEHTYLPLAGTAAECTARLTQVKVSYPYKDKRLNDYAYFDFRFQQKTVWS